MDRGGTASVPAHRGRAPALPDHLAHRYNRHAPHEVSAQVDDIDFAKQRLHLNRGLVAVDTRSIRPAARPRRPDAASISTSRPSMSSQAGARFKPPSTPQLVSTRAPSGCSPTATAKRCTTKPSATASDESWKSRCSPDPLPRSAAHSRQPADQGRCAGEGRERLAQPRAHRPHDPYLAARSPRYAGRRSTDLRAPRQARSTGGSRHGGTSEEDRVTR